MQRHAGAGNYATRPGAGGVANIDMIGQRLYTGRIVIAESAVIFAQVWAPHFSAHTLPLLLTRVPVTTCFRLAKPGVECLRLVRPL
eukprot:355050-Chlamydomonas_euryale.AAC.6